MSEVKIYDGVTIDISTSEVISHGEVTHVDTNEVSYLGGGKDKTKTNMAMFISLYLEYVPMPLILMGLASSLTISGFFFIWSIMQKYIRAECDEFNSVL